MTTASRRARAGERRGLAAETIIANAPDPVFVSDLEGKILQANEAVSELLGFRQDEVLEQSLSRFISPGETREFMAALREVVDRGVTRNVALRPRSATGEVIPTTLNASALRDGEGRVIGAIGILRDMRELDKARAYAESLIKNAPDPVFVSDLEGKILQANDAVFGLLGFRPDELIEHSLARILSLQETREFLAALREVVERGVTRNAGLNPRSASGEIIPTTLNASALRAPDGRVIGAIGILRDMRAYVQVVRDKDELLVREQAARAEAEAAQRRLAFLAEASTRLATSLDYEATLASVARLAVPELADYCVIDVVEADQSVRRVALVHADPARVALLRELDHRHPLDLGDAHPRSRVLRTREAELVADVTDTALRGWARDAEHLRMLRTVGLRSFMAVPLAARGRMLGVLSFIAAESGRRYGPPDLALAEDLARRAALAVDNARLYQEAQEAVRAREAFLARASHELRTPLTSALGTTRLLKKAMAGALKEPPEELVDIASRNLATMLALINNLLDASKLVAGGEPLSLEPVQLVEVVSRSLEAVGAQAREKGVALRIAVPAALRLPADAQGLEQVLVNLLANAVKFTPAGGEVVLEGEADGESVSVRVRDTGEGIPAEYLEAIFEPFVQAGRRRERGNRGTGLGLAICRQIVALHGGAIYAASDGPGRGSTFTVRLPTLPADERAA